MKLIIGNKNYSSWSLRGWLAMKQSGLHFDELTVPIMGEEWDSLKQDMGLIEPWFVCKEGWRDPVYFYCACINISVGI